MIESSRWRRQQGSVMPSDECLTAETHAWGSILFLKYYCHRPRVISPPGNDAAAARKQHSEICHVRVCARRASRGDVYCNTLPCAYSEPRALTTRRAGQVIGPIYRSNDILVQTWLGTGRKNNLKCVTLFFLFIFSDSCNGRVELSTIVPPSFFTGSKTQML